MIEDGQQRRVALEGALVVAAVATLLLQIVLALRRRANRCINGKHQLLPEGPPAWPIVGHLPLLMKAPPHQVLGDLYLKEGYGPIVGLRLGAHRTIVVSNAEFAKELLLTHDRAFANRIPFVFVDTLLYGFNRAVAFATYNPRWVWIRKMFTQELLSAKRLQELSHVRYDEVRKLMHRFAHAASRSYSVNVGECLADSIADSTARLIHSKTLSEVAAELPDLIRRSVTEAVPTLGDFFPFLRFLDAIPKRRMRYFHRRLDRIFDSIVDERRRVMASCSPPDLPNDFLQVLLSLEKNSDEEEVVISNHDVKAMMLDIFGASMHTTTATIEWAFAELLRNPDILQKLRDEVDVATKGKTDVVTDEDVQKMPFLELVVKETLRLHPSLPLLLPRISSADCKVGKYTVPKGTQAIVNMWAIARDPEAWENPESFYPERFEGKELDVRGQHYEFLPFGSGRRMCPGMRLGLSSVHVTLANLVKFFEWELPHGQSPAAMDMSEKIALGCSKNVPVLAIPTPRQHVPLAMI
ncbi:hypothetical protein GOP47_0016583 [Adiantum capillus-veneris]|uniref:Cytochrome P450 n=1 Tax=Adiantum capillus-veneris TaxID=13818 RepID=A0A9D4UIU8_ADICA|nr:hypothetical protein GOP47_0016583 [Adiantum capillus-veneris]